MADRDEVELIAQIRRAISLAFFLGMIIGAVGSAAIYSIIGAFQ